MNQASIKHNGATYNGVRWNPVAQDSSTVELQSLNCGVWITVSNSETHALNYGGKYVVEDRYLKARGSK